jgi:hypothetical protein
MQKRLPALAHDTSGDFGRALENQAGFTTTKNLPTTRPSQILLRI